MKKSHKSQPVKREMKEVKAHIGGVQEGRKYKLQETLHGITIPVPSRPQFVNALKATSRRLNDMVDKALSYSDDELRSFPDPK